MVYQPPNRPSMKALGKRPAKPAVIPREEVPSPQPDSNDYLPRTPISQQKSGISTRTRRVLPSRSRRGGPGVGSCDIDVTILDSLRRNGENEPLIPSTSVFILATDSSAVPAASTSDLGLNPHGNERYFDRPEVMKGYQEQLDIQTPEYYPVPEEERVSQRLRVRGDEEPPDLSDAAYERRHRKFETYEKRQRLREREKLKHEHYKLKERIEQLRNMDYSAFLGLAASTFAHSAYIIPADEEDECNPNGAGNATSVEGERRRRMMLDAAYALEERYRLLLPNDRKGASVGQDRQATDAFSVSEELAGLPNHLANGIEVGEEAPDAEEPESIEPESEPEREVQQETAAEVEPNEVEPDAVVQEAVELREVPPEIEIEEMISTTSAQGQAVTLKIKLPLRPSSITPPVAEEQSILAAMTSTRGSRGRGRGRGRGPGRPRGRGRGRGRGWGRAESTAVFESVSAPVQGEMSRVVFVEPETSMTYGTGDEIVQASALVSFADAQAFISEASASFAQPPADIEPMAPVPFPATNGRLPHPVQDNESISGYVSETSPPKRTRTASFEESVSRRASTVESISAHLHSRSSGEHSQSFEHAVSETPSYSFPEKAKERGRPRGRRRAFVPAILVDALRNEGIPDARKTNRHTLAFGVKPPAALDEFSEFEIPVWAREVVDSEDEKDDNAEDAILQQGPVAVNPLLDLGNVVAHASPATLGGAQILLGFAQERVQPSM